MTERRNRWTNLAPPLVREGIRAEVSAEGESAELYIYDLIDAWGGEWGVSAADVMGALATMPTVGTISVRLNSPGGDYFEGVAIYNALVRHAAAVTVHVDALAASAASVIAMAGTKVIMGQGAQMMIHEARSGLFGATADDMRAAALMLDQTNEDIAGFYAAKAGGDQKTWRAAVAAETWYTAAQAVDAGLADELAAPLQRTSAAYTATLAAGEVARDALEVARAAAAAELDALDVSRETQTPDAPVVADAVPPALPPVFDPEQFRSAMREASTR